MNDKTRKTVASAVIGGSSLFPLLAIPHNNGVGGILAFAIGLGVYHFYDDFAGRQADIPVQQETPIESSKTSKLPRGVQILLHGRQAVEEAEKTQKNERIESLVECEPDSDIGINDLEKPRERSNKPFLFSEILATFKPSLERIYLATRPDGTHIFVNYKALCHVALAGATDAGKSNIMRMLLIQLCSVGCQVLLLNPHWTGYVLDKDEDWTPVIPFLFDDPNSCRKYDKIDYYLKYLAYKTIPNRLDRYAESKPVGKPIFVVLDELPAIAKHVKDCPDYLDTILKEGRKVGVYLISAAQDFLVNTLGGTGEVRDCYRTAYSVGAGDTTSKKLLGTTSSDMPLGKGVVLLRNASSELCKEAITALVPYVDNGSLYTLLGPSTYVPYQNSEIPDDTELLDARNRMQGGERRAPMPTTPTTPTTGEKPPESEPNTNKLESSSAALPDGWTEEDVTFARRARSNGLAKDKVLQALGKRGAIDRLREELEIVTGEGAN